MNGLLKWFSIFLLSGLILYMGAWFFSVKKVKEFVEKMSTAKAIDFKYDSISMKSSLFDFGVIVSKPRIANGKDGSLMSFFVSSDAVFLGYNPFTGKLNLRSADKFNVEIKQDAFGEVAKASHSFVSCVPKEAAGSTFSITLKNPFSVFSKGFSSKFSAISNLTRLRYEDHGFDCKMSEGVSGESVSSSVMETKIDLKLKFEGEKKVVGKSPALPQFTRSYVDISAFSGGSEYRVLPKDKVFFNPSLGVEMNMSYEDKDVFSLTDCAISRFKIDGKDYSLSVFGAIKNFNSLTREFSGKLSFEAKNYSDLIVFLVHKYVIPDLYDLPKEDYQRILSTLDKNIYAMSESKSNCVDGKNGYCKDLSFSIYRDDKGAVHIGNAMLADFFADNLKILKDESISFRKDKHIGNSAKYPVESTKDLSKRESSSDTKSSGAKEVISGSAAKETLSAPPDERKEPSKQKLFTYGQSVK